MLNEQAPKGTLYDYLWENNKDRLDNYAFNYFGKKITYRRFFSMIDEAAKAFIAIGIKEKEIVPIVSISTVTSVVCLYALNKIGAVTDYLNVLSEEENLISLFKEANARVVVTLDLFAEKVTEAAKGSGVNTVIAFSITCEVPVPTKIGYHIKTGFKKLDSVKLDSFYTWKEFIKKGSRETVTRRDKDPEEMCILAHTGGTTGEPKAVMLSDNAMNSVVARHKSVFIRSKGYAPKQTFLQLMVPFYVYGILTCMHFPLCLGMCLALVPKFEPTKWKTYIKKYRFDHAFTVPAYVAAMLDDQSLQDEDLSFIQSISVGGDGLNDVLEKELNTFLLSHGSSSELFKGYGMSEICAGAVMSFPGRNKVGSVGMPLPGVNMMIFDLDRKIELPYRETGEICLQSPSRMIGYLNGEDDIFRVHDDGSEWLHTGDLGYIDEDGFLFIVGRIKRLIICTKEGLAYKVYPSVPEAVIDSHKSVLQSCIVGATDGENQVLRAFVVINNEEMGNKEQIEKELRDLCKGQLPTHSHPRFYVFCESLPLTGAGKIDYRALENYQDLA